MVLCAIGVRPKFAWDVMYNCVRPGVAWDVICATVSGLELPGWCFFWGKDKFTGVRRKTS